MSEPTTRAHGLWSSPITPKMLSQGIRLSDVAWDSDGRTLVWLEGRSDRGVLVTAGLDDPAPRDLTSDLSVRAMVGYGGGDFTVALGHVYFISGGRIYRQSLAGGPARPITPAFGQAASIAVSPDGRWLLFVHSYEHQDVLAMVDAEGKRWPVKLVEGRDFIMQPAWHPSGDRIAWVAWDHPNMPWDGTELWVAGIAQDEASPRLTEPRCLAGDRQTSVTQSVFHPDGERMAYISDAGGWGHLTLTNLTTGETRRITSGEVEYGAPAWQQGNRTFALVDGGRGAAVTRNEGGFKRLELVDLDTGATRTLAGDAGGYAEFGQPAASPDGSRLAAIASGPTQPARIVSWTVADGAARTWARSMGEVVPPESFSTPRPLSWTSHDGEQAHGLFYPPHNPRFTGPGLPPLLVLIHGGPTSQVTAVFAAQTQYFTSRGWAVLQVNYRGSTGYGRAYMQKLYGAWGEYDVEDARTGALALAERGLVDPARRVIMGGSAGGFTVLQSLVSHPGFYTAGICLYGVANQFTLVADTHKFEERYSDNLLGPLPQAAALYRERSPVFHAARISDPVAIFQGEIDQVVPKAQSDEIVASLKSRGVPHEYHVYAGEGHGWRRSDTIEQFYASVDRFLRQYVLFA